MGDIEREGLEGPLLWGGSSVVGAAEEVLCCIGLDGHPCKILHGV
jgi:hypothetical protein